MKGERYLKTVISDYGKVVRGEAEKEINDMLLELSNNNKIVSISFHNAGSKPFNLICNIWYEQGKAVENNSRFIKTVIMTIDEINKDNSIIEQKVNYAIGNIIDGGGKIINYAPHNFGFSPVLVLYDVIYEAEKPIG